MLLDNSMFDDGSFECHNFWIADEDGCYQVGANDTCIQHMKSQIKTAMSKGFKHLSLKNQELVYGSVLVLEIQWD